MAERPEFPVEDVLRRLHSADAGPAWVEFLDRYAQLIMNTAAQVEFEQVRIDDCFLFVCEKLNEDGFRRLLKFNTTGKARFRTWLTTVVFNLCVDWHRSEYPRVRLLPAIAALPEFDQAGSNASFIWGDRIEPKFISDDGRLVIFASLSPNDLTDEPGPGYSTMLYVRDRVEATTRLVSVSSDGSIVATSVGDPWISGNGRFIAFTAWTDLFEEYQFCCQPHIYLHDLGPTDLAEMIEEIADFIYAINLQEGITNSLDAKLESAMDALADLNQNNDAATCNSLDALISAVEAQSGNKIDPADADHIIDRTQEVQAELGCL